MCGIAMIIGERSSYHLPPMLNAIRKRGVTTTFNRQGKASIAFRHLPITDNAQFRQYGVGNELVYLNGFISNHKELKEKYSIHTKSNCDTEVLAKLLHSHGLDILPELNGFFAIAYYNGEKWGFYTDRWGIKQLYTYIDDENLIVCSEVKGVIAGMKSLGIDIEFDEFGVADWKHSLGVMNPNTIYKDVNRVPKLAVPFPKRKTTDEIPYEYAVKRLQQLWKKSIERNRHTDLPTGIFLSGGIDSGMIAKHIDPEYAFSVDYLDGKYSEIDLIKENTQGIHLTLIANENVYHKNRHKTASEALDDFKVGSCYTNYALTELASKFCTVLYSGAGGDELFGGYPHRNIRTVEQVIQRTDYSQPRYDHIPTHEEYNFKYLEGIFMVEDRMAGQFSMETRYPFLDNDLAEFVLSLPSEYVKNKRIQKEISGLSKNVINGRKRGFSNPHCTNKEWVDYTLQIARDEK